MFELNTTSNTRGHSKKMKIKTRRLDFTSLPEFDLMFMFAVKSYLHSWCFQCSSRPISKFLTVFACIADSGRQETQDAHSEV
jgi:hypothetical protein